MDIILLSTLFLFLSTVQSIIGVGVLVLGTPILLILSLNLEEILPILLPISILTSFLNLLLIKRHNKNLNNIINQNTKKIFYEYCLPSIIFGLLILKFFSEFINFQLLVSVVIILSILSKYIFKNQIHKIKNNKLKIIFSLIGLVHGLTNSGGTLISLFISSLEKNFKKYARSIISFFYLILALIQYVLFIIIFWDFSSIFKILPYIFTTVFGVFLGNYLIKFINEFKLKLSIEILASITAILLFLKGINLA